MTPEQEQKMRDANIMPPVKGQRVVFRYFPGITGTVMGLTTPPTLSPSIMVQVDQAIMDMAAGEIAPIALRELVYVD